MLQNGQGNYFTPILYYFSYLSFELIAMFFEGI